MGSLYVLLTILLASPNVDDCKSIRNKVNRRYKWTPARLTDPVSTVQRDVGSCDVNGKVYRNGQVIDSTYDMFRNHCTSTYCKDGRVVHWENWNCLTTPTPFPTTTPQTTTPPTTTPPTTTTTYITTTC